MQQLDCTALSVPLHNSPAQLGEGLVHVRVRLRVAAPQPDDQDPIVHEVHPPLTAKKNVMNTCSSQ